jgi:hypothetical protein
MPKENENLKPTDIVEVEVKGKKYKVTKAFKDDMDADRSELATKVTTVTQQNQTLAQRLEAMEKNPKVKTGGEADDGDDDEVTFADIMDRPSSAVSKAVKKELAKLGIDPSKLGNSGDMDQKVDLKLAQREWWSSFWKEHDYFDADVHGDLVESALKKLLPTLKDMKPKEARSKIAERVADMMGRAIVKGKLEYATESKHKAQNGMQLEGADGSDVDNSENTTDTDANKGKTGSMADDIRQLRAKRLKAAKGR